MSVQEKQEFLRTEVLERGYDQELFLQYFFQFTNNDSDLEKISLADLETIVKSFCEEHKPTLAVLTTEVQSPEPVRPVEDEFVWADVEPKVQQQPKNTNLDIDWGLLMIGAPQKEQPKKLVKPEEIKKPPVFQMPVFPTVSMPVAPVKKPTVPNTTLIQLPDKTEKPKQPVSSFNQSVQQNKQMYDQIAKSQAESSTYKCLRLQQGVMGLFLNVQFSIIDIKQQEKTQTYINKLFKANDLLYTVSTHGKNKHSGQGFEWKVQRKYVDFDWLRTTLLKVYPGLLVPPLPVEPTINEKSSLVSACNKLQYFLQELYRRNELRNSKYFEVFLSAENSTDLEIFKKSTQNSIRPKGVTSIINANGEVKINFSKVFDNYSTLIQDYVGKSTPIFRKVRDVCKEISLLYENTALKFHQFADICRQLKQTTSAICLGSSQIQSIQKLLSTYDQMAAMIDHQSVMILKDKDRFQNYFTDYFGYERTKIENLVSLVHKRTEFATQYEKKSGSGMFSKLSTAIFGQKAEYLDTPSGNYQTLKLQFGYYNHQLFQESIRFFDNQISSYMQHFTTYGHQCMMMVDRLQSDWSNMMVRMSKLQSQAYFINQFG